jgi:hypothetical protein
MLNVSIGGSTFDVPLVPLQFLFSEHAAVDIEDFGALTDH